MTQKNYSETEKLNILLKDSYVNSEGPIYKLMPDGILVECDPKSPEFTTEEFNNLFKD